METSSQTIQKDYSMKRLKLLVVFVTLVIDLLPTRAMAPEGDLQNASRPQQEVQQCVPPVAIETEGAAKSTAEKDGPQSNLSGGPTFIMRNETQSDKAQQPQGCTNTESNKWTDPITLFTLLLTGFTGLQWWTYRATLKVTKAIERAYVKMSTKGSLRTTQNKQYSVDVVIKNWGNTPARITHYLLTYYLRPREGKLPDSPDYGNSAAKVVGAFLVKGDSFNVTARDIVNEDDLMKCCRPGATHSLCILGYVDYVDKFGAHHRSRYASWYDPEIETFQFVTKDGYNHDHEQKEES
jgi:hypothetical protein